jgi:hypothetical protein
MKRITIFGEEYFLLDQNDVCPICGAARKQMRFQWRMFHGEVNSSCCGAIYQVKGFYIENPTKEEQKLLEALRNGFIWLKIPSQWIDPLKQAVEQTGKNIDSEQVKQAVEQMGKNIDSEQEG